MSRARHKRILKRQKQEQRRLRHAGLFFNWLAEQVLSDGGIMTFPMEGGITVEFTRPPRRRKVREVWPELQSFVAGGDSSTDPDGVHFGSLP